jgi:hypothetical protein
LGLFGKHKVLKTLDFKLRTNFAAFVNQFYGLRQEAKADGDKILEGLYKLILNSAYGKTGIDPRQFKETIIVSPTGHFPDRRAGWQCVERSPLAYVFERPIDHEEGELWRKYQNVAIAASITGAARAVLMEAIARADDPCYCDTDSLICRSLPADMLSETRLGAWKRVGRGAELAIAGKKMYAMRDPEGELVAFAHKGIERLSVHGNEWKIISAVARGQTYGPVTFNAPTIKLSGRMSYQKRTIKATAAIPFDTAGSLWPLAEGEFNDCDDEQEGEDE